MRKSSLVAAVLMLSACSSSPWHDDLMTNQQLMAADCRQLAVEEQKVADNAKHASENSTGGALAGALLSVLSAYHKTEDAGKNTTDLATQHEQQGKELENRRQIISTLRARKGC